MNAFRKINFKQDKYKLPLFLYPFIVGALYLFLDLFSTKVTRNEAGIGETTEYLNSNLPDANIKGDGIGGKHDNMRQTYGNILDLSAVNNLQAENVESEEFESKYTAEDLMYMLEQQRLIDEQQMKDSIRRALEQEMSIVPSVSSSAPEYSQLDLSAQRTAQLQSEIDSALAVIHAQSEEKARKMADSLLIYSETTSTSPVTVISDDAVAATVVKKGRQSSDYFHTIGSFKEDNSLITAIVDEDLTVVEGSRIRLRLLDDVEIEGLTVPKNTYVFALVGGFGSQRVTGEIKSILVGDRLIKVSLSIYDTDGLEGLYVPQSEFRQTGKDVAASALQSGNILSSGGYGTSSLTQMAMQSLQNAYQQTSNAVSKAIRKNKTKIKYGTAVYLINSKENK